MNGRCDRSSHRCELQPAVPEQSDLFRSGLSKRASDCMAMNRQGGIDQPGCVSAILLSLARRFTHKSAHTQNALEPKGSGCFPIESPLLLFMLCSGDPALQLRLLRIDLSTTRYHFVALRDRANTIAPFERRLETVVLRVTAKPQAFGVVARDAVEHSTMRI